MSIVRVLTLILLLPILTLAETKTKIKTAKPQKAVIVQEHSQPTTILVSAVPFFFLGFTFLDSRFQYEYNVNQDFSALVGLTYKYINSSDSYTPYQERAFGPNLYGRYYFSQWFTSLGFEYLKAKAESQSSNSEAEKWMSVARFIMGHRSNVFNGMVFEYGGGCSYYFNDVKEPVHQTGYKKGFLLSLHLGIGFRF